jgi:hypothetical protein
MKDHMHRGREGFIGWYGYGSSLVQWHPEEKVGIGYIPFDYIELDIANKRSKLYKKLLCIVLKEKQRAIKRIELAISFDKNQKNDRFKK